MGVNSLALSSWSKIYQQTAESNIDPNYESEPMPFTSVAYLSLAYVRTHLDTGPCRDLTSRDPTAVAAGLARIPLPQRHSDITCALLHLVHALSLPVSFGIEYVSQSQGISWCCQYSVCALECAIFLNKWLQVIAATQSTKPITGKLRCHDLTWLYKQKGAAP